MSKEFFRIRRVLKFGSISTFNTLLDFGVFFILYEVLSNSVDISQVFGYLCGMTSGYFLNYYLTFKRMNPYINRRVQFFLFIIIHLFTLLVAILLLNIFIGELGFEWIWAKSILLIVTFSINYTGSSLLVFGNTLIRRKSEINTNTNPSFVSWSHHEFRFQDKSICHPSNIERTI